MRKLTRAIKAITAALVVAVKLLFLPDFSKRKF